MSGFRRLIASVEKYVVPVRTMVESGLPKDKALDVAQSTWGLTSEEKAALYRVVWSRWEALERAGKRVPSGFLEGSRLLLDGYNVLTGLRSLLDGEAVLCDDDVVRDLKMGRKAVDPEDVEDVLDVLTPVLDEVRPSEVVVWFDAPVSGSGELASFVRRRLSGGLDGVKVKCEAVKGVDGMLVNAEGVPVTADSGVIDRVGAFFDVVREVAVRESLEVWIPPSVSSPRFVRSVVPG